MAAFTASLVSKSPNADGRIVAVVAYSNGPTTVKRQYTFDSNSSIESLRAMVASELANVSATYDLYVALTPGPLNLTPPAPPTPDPALQARGVFFDKLRSLRLATELQQLGIIDATVVTAIKNDVLALYLPAYLT